jgi:hypothetical protein
MNTSRRHTRASALLLVLWALLLLSAAIFTWATVVQDGLVLHSQHNRAFEAQAMAHSGLAVAMHPRVSRFTPLSEETVAPGQSYLVRMVSEGGKLNINWLLTGESEVKLTILRQWLERRGLDFKQREVFLDCLLDYVDADAVHRLNGHEGDKEYHPANRELLSVAEIAQVAGAGPLLRRPGWQDDLTIYSQGPIDLSSASPEILRLVPGVGETRLQQFVQFRRGKDGLDGTPDDYIFPDLPTVQQYLGLNQTQFAQLGGLVGLNDPTLRIISTGKSAEVTRQVEVVIRKGGDKPQILFWKE